MRFKEFMQQEDMQQPQQGMQQQQPQQGMQQQQPQQGMQQQQQNTGRQSISKPSLNQPQQPQQPQGQQPDQLQALANHLHSSGMKGMNVNTLNQGIANPDAFRGRYGPLTPYNNVQDFMNDPQDINAKIASMQSATQQTADQYGAGMGHRGFSGSNS